MAATLGAGGFTSCLADPDVWMRQACKPDGMKYWEYLLCYVDDVLVFSYNPQSIMEYISFTYTMKKGSIIAPEKYLCS